MSSVGILAAVGALLIGVPYLAWRYLGFRHIAPLAVVQIICGLSLGPSILAAFRWLRHLISMTKQEQSACAKFETFPHHSLGQSKQTP